MFIDKKSSKELEQKVLNFEKSVLALNLGEELKIIRTIEKKCGVGWIKTAENNFKFIIKNT